MCVTERLGDVITDKYVLFTILLAPRTLAHSNKVDVYLGVQVHVVLELLYLLILKIS